MSQVKRTFEQVQAEYNTGCARLGHMAYQIECVQEEMRKVKRELRAINKEAARLAPKPAPQLPSPEPVEQGAPSEQPQS